MSNTNHQFYAKLLDIGLEEYEPNEVKLQKENNNHNCTIVIDMFRDCTIRAISKILGKPWKEVFQGIMDIGQSQQTFHLNYMVKTYLENNGYKEVRNIYDDEMTVGEFICRHKRVSDRLIVTSKDHVAAVEGGVLYDSPRCIEHADQFLLSRHNLTFRHFLVLLKMVSNDIQMFPLPLPNGTIFPLPSGGNMIARTGQKNPLVFVIK